jgi:proline racemase
MVRSLGAGAQSGHNTVGVVVVVVPSGVVVAEPTCKAIGQDKDTL